MTGVFFLTTDNNETPCQGKSEVMVNVRLNFYISKGNSTEHHNFSVPTGCILDELDRFDGFTVDEKCFDRHEDSEYLKHCRYYIEVIIWLII